MSREGEAVQGAVPREEGFASVLRRDAWVKPFFFRYRKALALALFLGLLTFGFASALMFTSGYLVSASAVVETILFLHLPLIFVRIFGVGKPILQYLERLTSHDWVLRMTSGLRLKLYRALERDAVFFRATHRTGDVLGLLAEDIGHIQNLYLRTVFPTVTAWLLSLGGISGDSIWVRLLKPSSFTPVLALVGIIFFMFCKDNKKKDTGTVLLGFATLMFGMETMSSAVGGLADVPAFRQLFITFQNPALGLLAGAVLTAIIQSSSASVGILQALAVTGQVSYGAAIPIIMGQNIGTCVTALLSSVGANKNAKRAAFVHLSFNVIGSVVLLTAYSIVRAIFAPAILGEAATLPGIAVIHTAFNLLCVAILMPMAPLLEKLALRVIHDAPAPEHETELDERLLASPALALGQCREVTMKMADCAVQALRGSLLSVTDYTPALAEQVRADEEATDHYEDILGTYLVKLSSQTLTAADSENATELLKVIGDFERIADHAVNIVESAEELQSKGLTLSEAAQADLKVLDAAVAEILDRSADAFRRGDAQAAAAVEPLEQVVDLLKEQLRTRHILRMREGKCSIEAGFVWADLLTDLERTSDHCSNIAGSVIDMSQHNLNIHETLRSGKLNNEEYDRRFREYARKYAVK